MRGHTTGSPSGYLDKRSNTAEGCPASRHSKPTSILQSGSAAWSFATPSSDTPGRPDVESFQASERLEVVKSLGGYRVVVENQLFELCHRFQVFQAVVADRRIMREIQVSELSQTADFS